MFHFEGQFVPRTLGFFMRRSWPFFPESLATCYTDDSKGDILSDGRSHF